MKQYRNLSELGFGISVSHQHRFLPRMISSFTYAVLLPRISLSRIAIQLEVPFFYWYLQNISLKVDRSYVR